jgi:hypothetical protein
MTKSLLGAAVLLALVSVTGCAAAEPPTACAASLEIPSISFTVDPAVAAHLSTATLCWTDSCEKPLIRLLPNTASVPIACTSKPCPVTKGNSGSAGVLDLAPTPRAMTVSLSYTPDDHVVNQQLTVTPRSGKDSHGCGPAAQGFAVVVGPDGKARAA